MNFIISRTYLSTLSAINVFGIMNGINVGSTLLIGLCSVALASIIVASILGDVTQVKEQS